MYEEPFTVERAKSALAAIISSLESPQHAGDNRSYKVFDRIVHPKPVSVGHFGDFGSVFGE